jgi:hypothetical protein
MVRQWLWVLMLLIPPYKRQGALSIVGVVVSVDAALSQ